MSRLDSFIRRMEAQRSCLNHAATLIAAMPGPVFELGLGNGRTYDHLREIFPDRDIIVFDKKVSAHPSCIPPDEMLYLGEIHDTLPQAVERFKNQVPLVHSDMGSGDVEANRVLAAFIASKLPIALCSGGLLLSDQRMPLANAEALPLPDDVPAERYFMLRVA
ncbi:MAG: class I SAM-dependent methyltransferase [Pseudomonadota bacterium]